jgi:hypothetical protein
VARTAEEARLTSNSIEMSDDWNDRWYKATERRLPLWIVWAAGAFAVIVLIALFLRLG